MISVCMATFNGEKYIKEQLDSILKQLHKNDEIIVSDNGSTDQTLAIISHYQDSRIKIFHHKRHKTNLPEKYKKGYWCSQNFFNAIGKALGDVIFLADQDDLWKDNKIATVLEYLYTYDVVMSNISIIDGNGNIVEENFFKKSPISGSIINAVATNPYFGCAMAFKKSILKYVLPIPKTCVSYDLWIGCIAQKKDMVGFIDEPLINYRRHDKNISSATGESTNALWFRIYWRMQFFFGLSLRLILLSKINRK
jgi:glycosyltransferase involved in cell wall biosynthesis